MKYLYMLLFVALVFIQGCSTKVVSEPVYVHQNIQIVARPENLVNSPVKFYLVQDEEHGLTVGFSVEDYPVFTENMLNFIRYIEEQNTIILYYEESIKYNQENQK